MYTKLKTQTRNYNSESKNSKQLCVRSARIVKSKKLCYQNTNHKGHINITHIQQKGTRVPIHLQERFEKKYNKLIDQKQIIKLDKCSDKQFISLIVITVKIEQSMKLALDSKMINKFIHKIKDKIPSIE